MTIDGLIRELERRREMHGGSTEVAITWEGVWRDITPETVYLAPGDGGDDVWLVLDADDCRYKAKFQHPDDVKNNFDGKPWKPWWERDKVSAEYYIGPSRGWDALSPIMVRESATDQDRQGTDALDAQLAAT